MKNNTDLNNETIFHKTNPDLIWKRLTGFYGMVAEKQDNLIISRISGSSVLDIGSGYGFLLNNLKKQGYKAIGIEPAPIEIECSKKWWDVEVIEGSAYNLDVLSSNIENVVLRDVIFHLDTERFIPELKSINCKRVIVFMGNTGWLLLFAKWLLRHKEHDIKNAKQYIDIFKEHGYKCREIVYSDFFAFPLSGGYISFSFVPDVKWIKSFVMGIDAVFAKFLKFFRLQKYFAFRVMLVFDKA